MSGEKIDIFVGVDGGASNCRLRLEDKDGNLLGAGKSGMASIKWSIDETWNSIMQAFALATKEAEINPKDHKYAFHLGCGLAGCEIPQACQDFLSKTPKVFSSNFLQSDAYTACLGAHNGKDGSIIIVGTGLVAVQIDHGKVTIVGGWGFPHGDEGSASWLGMEVVRLTTQLLDGRIKVKSTLLSAVLTKFNDDATELVIWANQANAKAFATLAPLVLEHAKANDELAINLLHTVSKELDKVHYALLEKQDKQHMQSDNVKPLPCCLLGGLGPHITSWISEDLRSCLVECANDATVGAILMVKNKLKIR